MIESWLHVFTNSWILPKWFKIKKSPISLEKLSYGIYKLIMLSLLGVVRHAQACPKNFKITNWPFKVFWFFVVLVKSEGNFYGGKICDLKLAPQSRHFEAFLKKLFIFSLKWIKTIFFYRYSVWEKSCFHIIAQNALNQSDCRVIWLEILEYMWYIYGKYVMM